jgi:hypothetical protein
MCLIVSKEVGSTIITFSVFVHMLKTVNILISWLT